MKIFGIEFGGSQPPIDKVRTEPQAYSTPFMKVGAGNLSLPYIQQNVHKQGVIYFGQDNLFPQLLNQMYYTSPIHGAIVDFTVKAAIGGGFSVDNVGGDARAKVDFETFKRTHRLKNVVKEVARDLKLHNRCHFILKYSDSGKYLKAERVDPSTIRYRLDGDFEFSTDWSTNRDRKTIKAYRLGEPCTGERIYTYGEKGAGQDVYPLPTYSSALNWIFLDGEQSFLHKSNIQNSVFPSLVIRRPKRFGSRKEVDEFRDGLETNKGAENTGKVVVLTGDGFENTPEVVTISANNNDQLFIQTSKELKENICFAHEINPSIMGIKVAGSLGNAQELEMSYAIFEKNVVFPFRRMIEEVFNDLMFIAGIKGDFVINGFKIVGEEILEDENGISKTGELLNAMSPLLAGKVLNSLTINEVRSIAGLPPIEGGDELPSTQPMEGGQAE
jgi:hypothetical protein